MRLKGKKALKQNATQHGGGQRKLIGRRTRGESDSSLAEPVTRGAAPLQTESSAPGSNIQRWNKSVGM